MLGSVIDIKGSWIFWVKVWVNAILYAVLDKNIQNSNTRKR